MGNKQDGLEICVRSQGHDLIAITETWWDSSHHWNAVIDGYIFFRKDRTTRQGGGVAPYVRVSAWGQRKNNSRACELELRDRLIWAIMLWVCSTGHLTRRRKLMRPSTDS